jgi:hypothetical protein
MLPELAEAYNAVYRVIRIPPHYTGNCVMPSVSIGSLCETVDGLWNGLPTKIALK